MRKADLSALSRTRPWISRVTLAGTLCVAATGCGDAPTGPTAAWVATETAAALQLAGEPPTLGRIVANMGAKSHAAAQQPDDADKGHTPEISAADDRAPLALESALTLWREASNTEDTAHARALREDAYDLAAPYLAQSLGPGQVEAMRARMAEWIGAAERVPVGDELGLTPVLAEAREWLRSSREAEREGDREAAITGILHAADLLETLTPRAVAKRLLERAEAARSARPEAPESSEDQRPPEIRRADRLLNGARAAMARGEHVRAIQRAYYALRLLEES